VSRKIKTQGKGAWSTMTKNTIHVVRVVEKGFQQNRHHLLSNIRQIGIKGVTNVQAVKVYRLEGISLKETKKLATKLFAESLTQEFSINAPAPIEHGKDIVEVGYIPGVMNPEISSIMKAAHDLGIALVAVDTSWEHHFYGKQSEGDIHTITSRLLFNKTTQRVITEEPATLLFADTPPEPTKTIPVRFMTNGQLEKLSKEGQLFLNPAEMAVIRDFFYSIGRDASDVELETLAQTWSEHCKHKTFSAKLVINGVEKESLFKRLKDASKRAGGNIISAFIDNAGVISFYDDYGIVAKVETHNSPSALEPYGGAMTGTGGVFRDIMGTGKGARLIASTDMFCLAPPDLAVEDLPPGCLHPRELLQNIVAGVRDYGNRMGVPTNNGSVTFHEDFRAKPTVIVGSYGLAPAKYCTQGEAKNGHRLITIGGAIGRDGVHGATFSSGEMNAQTVHTSGSAVQIGNAIEQQRMARALLKARDLHLVEAITDCGAGGLSSAVGEMGSKTGVHIFLHLAPTKYPGLPAWIRWISESQERMVVAVAPKNVRRFIKLCHDYNVAAVDIGEFTDTKRLVVQFHDEIVCDLLMEFLHNGLPQRVMKATFTPQKPKIHQIKEPLTPQQWSETYLKVMGHLDVCSKKPITDQYDHTVQGTNVLPPFSGVKLDGPNDAAVLAPFPNKPHGIIISHGMNPRLMRIDPYHGAIWAILEALSNYVAVGGNITKGELGLVDNFIWPFPDDRGLFMLDQAMEAICYMINTFGIGFISGKDSLSSTYRFPDGSKLEIPPVLCISAVGRIPDISKTMSADFKKVGSRIVLVGATHKSLAGSVYADIQKKLPAGEQYANHIPSPAKYPESLEIIQQVYARIHQLIIRGEISACHDISQGGALAALAEMCIGGDCGAFVGKEIVNMQDPGRFYFNESPGCFLCEVPENTEPSTLFHDTDIPYYEIGTTTKEKDIVLHNYGRQICKISVAELKNAWEKPMKEVFA